MTTGENRLVMVGLDALPPELLERWCADGTLPNIAALRAESIYGHLDSVAGYLPGATWPTLNSASLPSVHGIYHFLQWDPDSMIFRRPSPEWCGYTPFWHLLGEQGVPVVAFDLPFSYPRQTSDKVIEAHGWGLHDELSAPFSNPPRLIEELRRRAPSGIRPDVLGPKSERMLSKDLQTLLASVSKRVSLIEELAQRFDWRLFLTVFPETHRAGHYFWGERVTGEPLGGLRQVAMAIDAAIPRLRALAPAGRFVLFSAHGMGPNYDFDRFSDGIGEYLEPATTAGVRRFDPVGLLQRNLPKGIRRALSAALPTSARDRLYGHYLGAGRDWRKVKLIFPPADIFLYVRANLLGRERDGWLTREEADKALDGVSQKLNQMTTGDGALAVAEVRRLAELFGGGPRSALLPDLVVKHRPFHGDVLRMADGPQFRVPWRDGRDGTHLETGFYIQTGGSCGTGPSIPGHQFARAMCESAGLTF